MIAQTHMLGWDQVKTDLALKRILDNVFSHLPLKDGNSLSNPKGSTLLEYECQTSNVCRILYFATYPSLHLNKFITDITWMSYSFPVILTTINII